RADARSPCAPARDRSAPTAQRSLFPAPRKSSGPWVNDSVGLVIEFSIVLAAGQNEFFVEIAEAICDELTRAGHTTTISRNGFVAQRKGLVNIVIPPHEIHMLERHVTKPTDDTLRRTIFVCAEQPGTGFFDLDVELGRRAGAVFDI